MTFGRMGMFPLDTNAILASCYGDVPADLDVTRSLDELIAAGLIKKQAAFYSFVGARTRRTIEYTAEFLQAHEAYPVRLGDNPKVEAFEAWQARINDGVDPAEMIAGVKRYRAYCDAREITGTEFVQQMATFFSPRKEGWRQAWKTTPAKAQQQIYRMPG